MKKAKIKYVTLIALDVLFSIIHIAIHIIIGDSYDLGLIPLLLSYLAFCLIYMIIHGIITYLIYHRVFYPHLITGIIVLMSIIYLLMCPYGNKETILCTSFFICVFFVISVLVSLITMFFCKLYVRKHSADNRQGDGLITENGQE